MKINLNLSKLCVSSRLLPAIGASLIIASLPAHANIDPWADNVVSYAAGSNAAAGFTDPTTSLGEPTRVTNPTSPFGGATTPFQAAFGTDEIVSIGAGGQLTVSFDEPITDDAANPFGIDLLVFGNAFFTDTGFPNGIAGGLFGEGGVIEVSVDGVSFFTVPGVEADGLFPTNGFTDPTGAVTSFGNPPISGTIPADFTLPVDPSFVVQQGDTLADILVGYSGSGGGVGIDLASVGLSEASFVRVSNPLGSLFSPEIDGFADVVPEPTSAALLAFGAALLGRRRRRRA